MTTSSALQTVRVLGGSASGKTQYLLDRVVAFLQEYGQGDALVFCASPLAVEAFARRLGACACVQEAPDLAMRVTVTTAREYALRILGTPDAIAWSGREARMLLPFEETFLMEDMKVSGLRVKRLREMLRFFYRSWTELEDEKDGWLITVEEQTIHTMIKDNLTSLRAYMEPEISSTAVRYLHTHDVADEFSAGAVFVDDYQCMSRASQQLAQLLACEELVIAGDAEACIETFDSYPYVAGLDEFVEAYPQTETVTLDGAQYRDASSFEVLEAEYPEDEMENIVQLVAERLASGVAPEDVIVATPNELWAKNILRAFDAEDIAAEMSLEKNPLRGDIRELDKCLPARVFSALGFVANKDDSLAWRCWCGFGNYLVHSNTVAALRAQAVEEGESFTAVLAALTERLSQGEKASSVGEEYMASAFAFGKTIISEVQGLTGETLLQKLTALVSGREDEPVPAGILHLCSAAEGVPADADAATLVAIARRRIASPALLQEHAVAVLPYDALVGASADTVIIAGFVNGFIPCHDYFDGAAMPKDKQDKVFETDTRRVHMFTTKANNLAISYFTTADLETASKLNLKIERIRLQNRVRTCRIAPSIFLDTLRG